MQGCSAHANAVKALAALAPIDSTIAFANFSQVSDWLFGWAQRFPDCTPGVCASMQWLQEISYSLGLANELPS